MKRRFIRQQFLTRVTAIHFHSKKKKEVEISTSTGEHTVAHVPLNALWAFEAQKNCTTLQPIKCSIGRVCHRTM